MTKYNKKKNSVFISGVFNVLHPGHVRLFKFASELADKVIVGLKTDSSESPNILPFDERKQALQCVSLINEIIEVHSVSDSLMSLQPSIVLKGSEFKDRYNEEEEVVANWGGEVVFSSGESQFNSDKYVYHNGISKLLPFPKTYHRFSDRHQINTQFIKSKLARIKELKVAVLGDSILDEYVNCDPVGLSREDPTIVVSPTDKKRFIGGAAIVATHTRTLGAEVDFYTLAGFDTHADYLEQELEKSDVKAFLYRDESRPTTVKRRYRSSNKTLLRVNEFRSHRMERKIEKRIIKDFSNRVSQYDLVIFADFNYGALGTEVVAQLQSVCRKNGVSMVADSQTSSQRGDLSKFKDLLLAAPTEIEARLAVDNHDNDIGLAVVIEEVAEKLKAENILITLGAEGAIILDYSEPKVPRVDSLVALNKNPVDVSGAGDLLLVTTSVLLKTGCDLWHASLVGMIASGVHIGEVGNNPISLTQLNEQLDRI